MRRVLLGLLLGVLIAAPLGYGASKLVANPMTSDLDAGFYSIHNVGTLDVSDAVNANGFHVVGGMPTTPLSLLAGTIDPTCCPALSAQPGSLYLRRVDDTHGELWLKTGANAGEWSRIAGTP